MERTYINEVQKEIGSTVKVQGFIENLRNSKYMAFIVLKDITGKLQITVEKEDHPELVDTIDKLTPDSVITVTGKVMENDYVKMGGIEIIPEAIEIESIADALPIVRKEIAATKKKKAVERSSIDQRIDYRWIDLRTDENQLMFKAQSCFVNAMRQFLLERSFIELHTLCLRKLTDCHQLITFFHQLRNDLKSSLYRRLMDIMHQYNGTVCQISVHNCVNC